MEGVKVRQVLLSPAVFLLPKAAGLMCGSQKTSSAAVTISKTFIVSPGQRARREGQGFNSLSCTHPKNPSAACTGG